MYKHILVPTDGSTLATKGVRAGIRLAKALGARITAVYVVPPYMPSMYGEAAMYVPPFEPGEYRRLTEKQAGKILAAVEAEARRAGVRCRRVFLTDPSPGRASCARRAARNATPSPWRRTAAAV